MNNLCAARLRGGMCVVDALVVNVTCMFAFMGGLVVGAGLALWLSYVLLFKQNVGVFKLVGQPDTNSVEAGKQAQSLRDGKVILWAASFFQFVICISPNLLGQSFFTMPIGLDEAGVVSVASLLVLWVWAVVKLVTGLSLLAGSGRVDCGTFAWVLTPWWVCAASVVAGLSVAVIETLTYRPH